MGHMIERAGSLCLSVAAGIASFVFTLAAFLMIQGLDEQIVASLSIGLFALLIVWLASEKPNSGHSRAVAALIDRLLAVGSGDLASPAPRIVREQLPALASAVDNLFAQVRSNLDDVHAMAMYDPVTALPNRTHFRGEAERMIADLARIDGLALFFIDLDGFKEVNDNLGHAQGDRVLAEVARRLRHVVKGEVSPGGLRQPVVARLAGDEFTMIFPHVATAEEAERIARTASLALSEPFHEGDQRIEMSASVGIALAPDHGDHLTSLMKAADIAMYHAKSEGRSQVCLYRATFAAAFELRAQTEKALRQALIRGEFELAFQPEICARTGEVVAGEALLRWNHPDGQVRLPGTFIAAAEESSLIVDIGDWAIDAVTDALGRWAAAGMTQRLAVNVSPRQLERPTFFRKLRTALDRSGTPPWLLELEFTETMAMRCSRATVAELSALRKQGISIAIDDFGTGYSNLARLKDMPLDRVKIDRSIIQDVDRSESARTIVNAVIHLIHGLGCEVVAEGVERMEQIEVLRAIGRDIFQGFAYSGALKEDAFLDWVAAHQLDQRRSA